MSIRFPTSLFAARPPQLIAAKSPSEAGAAAGRAASAGRLLFDASNEPGRLMLGACKRSALAGALSALAAVGALEGWQPFYPLLPFAFMGLAVTTALRIDHFFDQLEDYEQRQETAAGAAADRARAEVAELRNAMNRLENARAQARDAAGAAAAGNRDDRSFPAAGAANVYPFPASKWGR